jgi:hypothetical protein
VLLFPEVATVVADIIHFLAENIHPNTPEMCQHNVPINAALDADRTLDEQMGQLIHGSKGQIYSPSGYCESLICPKPMP